MIDGVDEGSARISADIDWPLAHCKTIEETTKNTMGVTRDNRLVG
jgi:hypothetical protein